MKPGDMVLFDRFGTSYDSLSPSTSREDFGLGIILQVFFEQPGGVENSYAQIVKDDGVTAIFSMSYLLDASTTV